MDSGDGDRDGGMNRVYHERQSRQLCALHVLNNLFQEPNSFVQANLDGICHEVQATKCRKILFEITEGS